MLFEKGEFDGAKNITYGEWSKILTYEECAACKVEFFLTDEAGYRLNKTYT